MLLNSPAAPSPGPPRVPVTERLWRDVHERLTAFVARRVDEPADVADIVQSVFLRVHQHVKTVADEDRLLPWLFQVTRNAIADFYRAPARRRELPLGIDSTDTSLGDGSHDPSSEMTDPAAGRGDLASQAGTDEAPHAALSELSSCVRPMIEQMTPRHREALKLVDFEGQSQVDAANALGISISGMKSRVQRGRAELRELLLACCDISRSATGGVLDFAPRSPDGCDGGCGPSPCVGAAPPISRDR